MRLNQQNRYLRGIATFLDRFFLDMKTTFSEEAMQAALGAFATLLLLQQAAAARINNRVPAATEVNETSNEYFHAETTLDMEVNLLIARITGVDALHAALLRNKLASHGFTVYPLRGRIFTAERPLVGSEAWELYRDHFADYRS